MTSAVLTPFVRDAARQAGTRLWRKRLLPAGSINYKGRQLTFDPGYLSRLAAAFRDQAYPQVPFQLAPDDNSHTNDPERFAGEVTDMSAEPDGLWITLAATERGNRVLAENPRLGVSARIVEAFERSDGKYWPEAVQHVLGTLDPRIPGLGGWQTVEASNDAEITIDLSGTQFTASDDDGDLADLNPTPDEWDALLDTLLEIEAEELAAAEAEAYRRYHADDALMSSIGQVQQAIELSMEHERQQAAEDSQPLPPGDEARLAVLLGRAGRRSAQREVLNFAGPYDEDGGPVTGQPNCGYTDPGTGLCIERYHDMGCGSMASGDVTEALRPVLAGGARAPYRDEHGWTWVDQNGRALTTLGMLESTTGQRLTRESAFETGQGRRELTAPQSRRIWRDRDDEDDPGIEAPALRATTTALARQLGLTGPDTAQARNQARTRRDGLAAAQRLRTGGRGHLDVGETTRERAERLHRPQHYVAAGDGLGGALVPLTRG